MQRILCLDVGERRIGAAVSDLLGITAQGLPTIPHTTDAQAVEQVLALAASYETDRILCGLPRNMDGTLGFQARYVEAFAEKLLQRGLQVRYCDERLTTAIARRTLLEASVRREKRRQMIDRLAAVQILSTVLEMGGWERALCSPDGEKNR